MFRISEHQIFYFIDCFLCCIISASINASDTDVTIPCTPSNTPLTSLIWRFNHSHVILNQTRTDSTHTVSEEWRQQVKGVSESGSLTLQGLSSSQNGIYTCKCSNDEETYVKNTFLRIEQSQGKAVGSRNFDHVWTTTLFICQIRLHISAHLHAPIVKVHITPW